jgi:ABC-type multidrug transport system ATPase subunit
MYELQLASCKKIYGRTPIFSDLSHSFRGHVLGIGGPNGSGKTTLLKLLAGLLTPSAGSIRWSGPNFVEKSPSGLHAVMSTTAPYVGLYPDLTLFENLKLVADLRGLRLTQPELHARIGAGLGTFGIAPLSDRFYSDLSSGQQQRARLAAATFFTPEILFLDEPGSMLDADGQELIATHVKERQSLGLLTVIASNDPAELALCEEVIRFPK